MELLAMSFMIGRRSSQENDSLGGDFGIVRAWFFSCVGRIEAFLSSLLGMKPSRRPDLDVLRLFQQSRSASAHKDYFKSHLSAMFTA